jgi:hypothetical protein
MLRRGVVVSWGAQEGKDSEDAAVIAGCVAEAEFGEDLTYVGFHGLGAEEQLVADALVGVTLGHQGEDLAFAVGELGERAAVTLAGHEPRHDGRVDDTLALGHAPDGIGEHRDVGDAFLEQVPDPFGVLWSRRMA